MQAAVQSDKRVRRLRPNATHVDSKRKSPFDRYGPEKERAVRGVDVNDEVLQQLRAAWKRFGDAYLEGEEEEGNYLAAIKAIKDVEYTARDVEKFSIAMAEFQDEEEFGSKAGDFLSALINEGSDSSYTIHTRYLNTLITGLGHNNTKHIQVEGDVGKYVGYKMKGGSITINGSSDDYLGGWMEGGRIIVRGDSRTFVGGTMKGGEIIVEGNTRFNTGAHMEGGSIVVEKNTDSYTGNRMEGGKIVVKGNSGKGVGNEMQGGEIHLEGEYESIAMNTKGGNIYHKGELIIEDGKDVEIREDEW